MAGFLLWYDSISVDSTIFDRFKSLDYREPSIFKFDDLNIWLYPKNNIEVKNYFEDKEDFIFGVGTYIYKGLLYNEALPLILFDFLKGKLDYSEILGEYIIFVKTKKFIGFIRDASCLKHMYTIENCPIFSTSFDALLSIGGLKNINLMSVVELLTTGVISGNDTILQEIKRVAFCAECNSIKIIEISDKQEHFHFNYRETITFHKNKLLNYFKKIKLAVDSYKYDFVPDIGLTAGLDSRLLVALINNVFDKNFIVHTHWRKAGNKDIDFNCAHLLAETMGVKINVSSPKDLNFTNIQEIYEKSYIACDGVIRPGCYWDEIYSTHLYRNSICDKNYFRFLGFGGENYRNSDHILLSKEKSLRTWIEWDLVYMFNSGNVIDKSFRKKFFAHIENNLYSFLNDKKINLKNYKKYVKFIQSPSYRSIQSNIENRLSFSLNPFMDINLVNQVIEDYYYLGDSLGFQLDILNGVSKKIASVDNDYGFNFVNGEPLRNRIFVKIWKYVPSKIKYPIYFYIKNLSKRQKTDVFEKNSFIIDLFNEVKSLNLPMDLDKYIRINSRYKMLFNLGYFLKRNKRWINKN